MFSKTAIIWVHSVQASMILFKRIPEHNHLQLPELLFSYNLNHIIFIYGMKHPVSFPQLSNINSIYHIHNFVKCFHPNLTDRNLSKSNSSWRRE
jgi:hypothetical protein